MKRFDIEVVDNCAYLVGNPDGKYVRHADMSELVKQHKQLLAALGDEVVVMAFNAYRKELVTTKDGAESSRDRDFVQGLIDRLDAAHATIAAVKGGATC